MKRVPAARTGQASGKLPRESFAQRFQAHFFDPAFDAERDALARIEQIAWCNHEAARKAPRTVKAGRGFADPTYEISTQWLQTHKRLRQAQRAWGAPATPSRVLLVNASARNDATCPGEVSKSWRLSQIARAALEHEGIECDLLDLSLLTSDYARHIHPCKGCVSTAMPLCHWPCSCYPNHALGQNNDWMAEIYEQWVRAHGVMLLTPTYWYQVSSPLKLMMDRLVCADGGNADPTSTHGKNVHQAKQLELAGWPYPKHLAGRAYALVVHGDVAGIEGVRRSLADWLDWMGLIAAGSASQLERYIGYYAPYATSHVALDADAAVQQEVQNAARALAQAVLLLRRGALVQPGKTLRAPRPK